MASKQIEISVNIDGYGSFEYFADVVPRVGEWLGLNFEDLQGDYQVTRVKHEIRKDKTGEIVTYVEVYV